MINVKYKQVVSEIYDGTDESIQNLIFELRRIGASQMESTQVLIFELGYSLVDADLLVVNSDAWKDLKQDVENLREKLNNEAIKLMDKGDGTN